MLKKVLLLCPVLFATVCLGQEIQVNRQNKTIAVSADDSITTDAEVAVLDIGYRNYAPTQEAAFRENVRVADQITQTLLQAKIPADSIETEKLSLGRAQADQNWTEQMKREGGYGAQQSGHGNGSAGAAHTGVRVRV